MVEPKLLALKIKMEEVKKEVSDLLNLIGTVKTLSDKGELTLNEARILTRYPLRAIERRRCRLTKYGYKNPKVTFAGVFGSSEVGNIKK